MKTMTKVKLFLSAVTLCVSVAVLVLEGLSIFQSKK